MVWTCSKNGRGKVIKRGYELAFTRKKKMRKTWTHLGGRDKRTDGRKGIGGGRLERQTELEEEDNIINKLAEEDVNTLYSLLSNNNKNNKLMFKLNTCLEKFLRNVAEWQWLMSPVISRKKNISFWAASFSDTSSDRNSRTY
jgi:hypothetical protein